MRAKHQHSHEHHAEMQNEGDDEKPTMSELMINQLEIANMIIVNKTDLVTKEQLEKVTIYLKSINPNTEIVPTVYSKVDLKDLIKVKRFDLETAEKDQKWITEKEKI